LGQNQIWGLKTPMDLVNQNVKELHQRPFTETLESNDCKPIKVKEISL